MYDLVLYNRLGGDATLNTSYEANITQIAPDWSRTIGAVGGYLMGDFTLTPGDRVTTRHIVDFYGENMGKRIVERTGGITTWEGEIVQMELTLDGMIYRRTLNPDEWHNKVKVRYGPDATTDETAYSEDADSSREYGESVLIDVVQSGYNSTSATARRDRILTENAYPRSRPIGGFASADIAPSGGQELAVLCAGYVYSMNRRYQETDLAAGNVSDHISTLVGNSEYVTAGNIYPNTLQAEVNVSGIPGRLWNEVQDLISQGAAAGARWVGGVYGGRRFEYKAAETGVTHHWRNGKLLDGTRHPIEPTLILPDIIVRVASTVTLSTMSSGSVWDDPRNMYIEEVEFIAPHSYRLTPRYR